MNWLNTKAPFLHSFKLPAIGITVLLLVMLVWYFLLPSSNDSQANEQSEGPPPALVVVASATQMTMSPSAEIPGTVVSLRDSVIAAETSGKVIRVANIGDEVQANGSLAEIDNTDAKQLVTQREAELKRLQSLAKYHRDYYTRIDEYDHKLGLSDIAIAELQSNRDTASADVARGEAALSVAKTALERTSIKAPFAGSVVSQSIQTGEYAHTGDAVLRLVDTQNLEVSAQVPASLVLTNMQGLEVEIVGQGKSLKAPIRALVPVGDSISRTMELRVSIEAGHFMVGAPVRVKLPTSAPKSVVAIPRDALILRSNSQYVFVIDADKIAHKRDVQLGYAEGEMIEVIGEIAQDATVVVRGGERLRDGQAVSWQTEEA